MLGSSDFFMGFFKVLSCSKRPLTEVALIPPKEACRAGVLFNQFWDTWKCSRNSWEKWSKNGIQVDDIEYTYCWCICIQYIYIYSTHTEIDEHRWTSSFAPLTIPVRFMCKNRWEEKNTELMIMMLQHWGEISGRWGKVTLFDMNWVKISKSRSEKVSI